MESWLNLTSEGYGQFEANYKGKMNFYHDFAIGVDLSGEDLIHKKRL
jgi:hypothetical protein